MSRIGRAPVKIPEGVKVELDGSNLTVKGSKGELKRTFHKNMKIDVKDGEIVVTRPNDDKLNRSLHGLTRALINNMIIGVTQGFKKDLEIKGVGYRAQKKGKELVLNLGFSHQVIMEEEDGISIEVKDQNSISISGIDKCAVGQFAANVRNKKPPEPYKGKGIRYAGEFVATKDGKAGKSSKS